MAMFDGRRRRRRRKEKKHTIERKMQISKVDETYCVLRYNIWQIEHTSKDYSFLGRTWGID
jgi:hypothetical protein